MTALIKKIILCVCLLVVAFGVTLSLGLLIKEAKGQGLQVKRAEVVNHLGKEFGEAPVFHGTLEMRGNHGIMEVFNNPETGTYTVIFTDLQANTFYLGSGDGGSVIKYVSPGGVRH